MSKKSKFSNWYVKYIIKIPIIFYSFLILGMLLFVYLSFGLQLDVLQSVKAEITNNTVIIGSEYNSKSDTVYIYNDRNEKVYKFKIKSSQISNLKTVLIIDNDIGLYGEVNADIITGSQTLFERIFIKAGKG